MAHDNLSLGIRNLIYGYRVIFSPGIRLYAFIPILINVLLYGGFYILAWHYFNDLLLWFKAYIPSWLQWLSGLLWLFFGLTLLLITSYTFSLLANIVAAPFNGMLAEQIEFLLTGKSTNSSSFAVILKDAPRSISRQLHYLGYYLPRAIAIALLFFVPGGQLIIGPVWFLFNAWTQALQYMDYPMDNHKISFIRMQQQLKQQRLTTLSFGLLIAALSMLPIFNLLLMPAAVAAAVKLWLEKFADLQQNS